MADEWLGAAATEAAENEGDDDRVVELACDWNEVGNELKTEVRGSQQAQLEKPVPTWEARVAKLKPSDGLEPSAPSLPSRPRFATGCDRLQPQGSIKAPCFVVRVGDAVPRRGGGLGCGSRLRSIRLGQLMRRCGNSTPIARRKIGVRTLCEVAARALARNAGRPRRPCRPRDEAALRRASRRASAAPSPMACAARPRCG